MPAVPADVTPAYLAIDWGTTNRRIYVIANDGTMLDTIRDDRGVLDGVDDRALAPEGRQHRDRTQARVVVGRLRLVGLVAVGAEQRALRDRDAPSRR